MGTLTIAPFADILRKAGAKRVSHEAARELAEIVEEIALEIARDAVRVAHHAGRKTIKARDIEFVAGK